MYKLWLHPCTINYLFSLFQIPQLEWLTLYISQTRLTIQSADHESHLVFLEVICWFSLILLIMPPIEIRSRFLKITRNTSSK